MRRSQISLQALSVKLHLQVIAEAAFVFGAYSMYTLGRGFVYDDHLSPAFDNAWEIIGLERVTGIFREPVLQDFLIDNVSVSVHFFNWFYILGYWPVILGVAVYLYMNNREAYFKYRTVALITLGVALLIYELYPLAPPRMVTALGFVDTLSSFGLEEYHSASDALLYNPFAAMPSLHFALAFIASLHFLRRDAAPVPKMLFSTYLGLMLAAIVVTGNHYFVDAVGSMGVVGAAFFIRNASITTIRKMKGDSDVWFPSLTRDVVGGRRT
jgi:hypothetical protein